MWVLCEPGATAVVPSPAYPIHLVAPRIAGAAVVHARLDGIEEAVHETEPPPRAVIVSYPHNPTTACAELEDLQRLVDLAREREFVLVHDFAYADIAFAGHQPPSVLQCEGALECAVGLWRLSLSFSMAVWRGGLWLGRPDVVAARAQLTR